jgi:hypothetical protein
MRGDKECGVSIVAFGQINIPATVIGVIDIVSEKKSRNDYLKSRDIYESHRCLSRQLASASYKCKYKHISSALEFNVYDVVGQRLEQEEQHQDPVNLLKVLLTVNLARK